MKILDFIALKQIYPNISNQKLPIKTTYKFTKLFDKVNEESTFYTTQFKKLLNQYAEIGEDGKQLLTDDGEGFKLKEETLQEGEERFKELLSLEVEVPDIKFTIEELESLSLKVDQLSYLLPFITE